MEKNKDKATGDVENGEGVRSGYVEERMVATKSIKWGLGIAVIRGSGPALPLFSQTATNCALTVSPIVHKLYH